MGCQDLITAVIFVLVRRGIIIATKVYASVKYKGLPQWCIEPRSGKEINGVDVYSKRIIIYPEKLPRFLADDNLTNCYGYTVINVKIFRCDGNSEQTCLRGIDCRVIIVQLNPELSGTIYRIGPGI